FAPVADQTAKRFHTTMDMVNWLSIVYLVISVPVGFLAVWILDTVGLKCAVLLCAWLNMTGSIIRIFSVLDFLSLGSLNFAYLLLGQCLCAMAQPLIIFSPTKLAALWFPDHQRATANMIGSMSNPLGLLIANLLSPAIVQEDKDIPLLLGVYAGPAAFACVLATFGVHQKVPPTPPSASAFQSDSLSFSGGLKMLLRNKAYLILAASLGSGIALVTCYSALLEQILCVNGYSDSFAGMCGAFFTVFGLIGAFFLGLYVDRTKKFTEVTKICFCLTALASTAFAVMSHYRNQTYAVATFSALFGLFGFALYPVAMELAVECSYPVGEGTSSGLIFKGFLFSVLLGSGLILPPSFPVQGFPHVEIKVHGQGCKASTYSSDASLRKQTKSTFERARDVSSSWDAEFSMDRARLPRLQSRGQFSCLKCTIEAGVKINFPRSFSSEAPAVGVRASTQPCTVFPWVLQGESLLFKSSHRSPERVSLPFLPSKLIPEVHWLPSFQLSSLTS
uniref:Solute carrier family 49 member 3 n=1 Tax=Varanus komodoensis TaxID=61221 RepID=A0A8D2IS16_VARKO